MATPIVNPVGYTGDEDDDILSVNLKKISVEELEDGDLLLSVNSLMNFVELHKFDADQLKQLMCELLAAGQSGMLNDRSQTTVKQFIARYSNFVHEFAPQWAKEKQMPRFDSKLTTEERAADVRFFKNVTLREKTAEHRSGDANWQADAEKRWLAAAKERLDEITRDLNKSTWTPDTPGYCRSIR